MKRFFIKKNKRGFTLLEIIIVVIIVGVLASLALPRLFSTVEFSRSSEAMASLTSLRSSMERCYMTTRDYALCDTFNDLDLVDPAGSPGAHFTYGWPVAATATNYTITATRNTLDGGTAGDTVQVAQAGLVISRSGTTAFRGVK